MLKVNHYGYMDIKGELIKLPVLIDPVQPLVKYIGHIFFFNVLMRLNCISLAETLWTALFQNYIETIMEEQPTCTILYYLHHLTGL